MSKIVITSGPSSGKTSIIRELSARGFKTMPEAARLLINQGISEGKSVEEIRSSGKFQDKLIKLDKAIEENNKPAKKEVIFMDRSLADNIGYLRFNGREAPQELYDICENRYDKVFLLERLEFEDEEVRTENEEEAEEIHRNLREAYLDLGYNITEVPVVPIDERADLVLEELKIEKTTPHEIYR